MEYIEYSYRYAKAIIESDKYLKERYDEFLNVLKNISDDDLSKDFTKRRVAHEQKKTNFKSITPSINFLLKKRIKEIPGWETEVDIFNDETNNNTHTEWRLDFACENAFAVEVAFNHGEAICWNLLKPVLASELNHVKKQINTQLGIYVCATDDLKLFGNIDSASGSFEKVLRYLKPLSNQLTIPIMIIGLKAPKDFFVSVDREIKPISDYRISYRQMINIAKKSLDSANMNYETGYLIKKKIKNKSSSQRLAIFCPETKFGIYNKAKSKEMIDLLTEEGYNLIESGEIVTYDDILELHNKLRNL